MKRQSYLTRSKTTSTRDGQNVNFRPFIARAKLHRSVLYERPRKEKWKRQTPQHVIQKDKSCRSHLVLFGHNITFKGIELSKHNSLKAIPILLQSLKNR